MVTSIGTEPLSRKTSRSSSFGGERKKGKRKRKSLAEEDDDDTFNMEEYEETASDKEIIKLELKQFMKVSYM